MPKTNRPAADDAILASTCPLLRGQCDPGNVNAYSRERTFERALLVTTTRDEVGGYCGGQELIFDEGAYSAALWLERFGVSLVRGRYVAPSAVAS